MRSTPPIPWLWASIRCGFWTFLTGCPFTHLRTSCTGVWGWQLLATVTTELSFHLHMNTVPSQRRSNVPWPLVLYFFGGRQITVWSSCLVFPHCASTFHFLGCQVGKELVGCEEVVEEVVLCNIRILPNNFNHVIDDPRAEGLVAGCCLLAFVDWQVVRTAVRTAKAPELVPEADGLSTNEHLRTVAIKVWHHRFINRQIFVEHSKFGKGGVNIGVNWPTFAILLPCPKLWLSAKSMWRLMLRKLALLIAFETIGTPRSSQFDQWWSSSGRWW